MSPSPQKYDRDAIREFLLAGKTYAQIAGAIGASDPVIAEVSRALKAEGMLPQVRPRPGKIVQADQVQESAPPATFPANRSTVAARLLQSAALRNHLALEAHEDVLAFRALPVDQQAAVRLLMEA